MYKSATILLVSLLLGSPLSGQFLGGIGDGVALRKISSNSSVHNGGLASGYQQSFFKSSSSIYLGGNNDGFAISDRLNEFQVYKGGPKDGYNMFFQKDIMKLYSGGTRDGYDSFKWVLDFLWTGNVSSMWDDPDNWNTNLVPTISRKVFIPTGRLRYPILLNGILSIGESPLGGDYFCSEVTIATGATLTLSPLAELINIGTLNISGDVMVQRTIPDALRNINGGKILLMPGGTLTIGQ